MNLVAFPHDNGALIIAPDTPPRIWWSYKYRPYHESMFRQIAAFLIKQKYIHGNIIDLGSWIGDNATVWAKIHYGDVYAIDPSPDNCKYITAVKDINKLSNLHVLETAISDKDEIISTNYDLGHAMFYQNTDFGTKVTATSLDNLVDRGVIANIGFIHLDVEGMELAVLKGSRKIIEATHPTIVYEIHLADEVENNMIKVLLEECGYTMYLINDVLPGCRPDCRNVLAVPPTVDFDIVDEITTHLNTYSHVICLHVAHRVEILKFINMDDAFHIFTLLKGDEYACVLLDMDALKVLGVYGEMNYINACFRRARNLRRRYNYFSQL